jgi:hypothetical protein
MKPSLALGSPEIRMAAILHHFSRARNGQARTSTKAAGSIFGTTAQARQSYNLPPIRSPLAWSNLTAANAFAISA